MPRRGRWMHRYQSRRAHLCVDATGCVPVGRALLSYWQYTRTLARRIQSFIDVSNDGRLESERSSCIITFRGERNWSFGLEFRSVEKVFSQEGREKLVAYSGKLRGPGINVVVGSSGAGKSTLVRVLAGVDYYSSGAVVDGQGQELCP